MIVQDPTLLHQVDVFAGLRRGRLRPGQLRRARSSELGLGELTASCDPAGHASTVPATELAREHLGRPLPNAALLGGFAALTGLVVARPPSSAAIRRAFPGRGRRRQRRRRPRPPTPQRASAAERSVAHA